MSVVVRTLYYFSVLFVLANLFFAYYQLPENVILSYDVAWISGGGIDKSIIFYTSSTIFLITNLFNYIIRSLMANAKSFPKCLPHYQLWSNDADSQEQLVTFITNRTTSLVLVLNFNLGLILFSFFVIVVTQTFTLQQLLPAYLAIAAMLAISIITFVVSIFISKPHSNRA